MGEDVLIFAVLTTGLVLIAIQVGRLLRAGMQHRTIREALSRDSSDLSALLANMEQAQPSTNTDDRTAIVLIAFAAALFLFGVIQGDPDDLRNMGGAALFPGFVGIGLLVRFYLARKQDRIS